MSRSRQLEQLLVASAVLLEDAREQLKRAKRDGNAVKRTQEELVLGMLIERRKGWQDELVSRIAAGRTTAAQGTHSQREGKPNVH